MVEPTVIYHSRLRLILIAFGSMLFVALGWLLIQGSDPITVTVGASGIAFFGLCLVFALWRLVLRKPALVLDAKGITDTASAVSSGFIPWSDITGMRIVTVRNQKMLGIDVADTDAVIAQYPAFRQWLMRMNVRMVGTPIVIPRAALGISLEKLVPLIETHLPAKAAPGQKA